MRSMVTPIWAELHVSLQLSKSAVFEGGAAGRMDKITQTMLHQAAPGHGSVARPLQDVHPALS